MDTVQKALTLTGLASFALPAAEEDNNIVTDVAISGLTAGALTIADQPDYPRNISATLTDANATITTAIVTVVGVDQNGVGISDAITCTAGAAVYGSKAFAYVTSATIATTGTVTATDDKIKLGLGNALGLPAAPGATYLRMIRANFNGDQEAGTFGATYGTYNPTGTLDGAKPVEVLYLYRLPIDVF